MPTFAPVLIPLRKVYVLINLDVSAHEVMKKYLWSNRRKDGLIAGTCQDHNRQSRATTKPWPPEQSLIICLLGCLYSIVD